jgi:hypothetical protein
MPMPPSNEPKLEDASGAGGFITTFFAGFRFFAAGFFAAVLFLAPVFAFLALDRVAALRPRDAFALVFFRAGAAFLPFFAFAFVFFFAFAMVLLLVDATFRHFAPLRPQVWRNFDRTLP